MMTNPAFVYEDYKDLPIEKFTNLFLYGQETKPTSECDAARPQAELDSLPFDEDHNKYLPAQVDTASFMEDGPGRFAYASNAKFVQDFLASIQTIPEGTAFTKDQIMDRT